MHELLTLIEERNRLWTLMFACMIGALIVLGILAAANSDLSREEHAYQLERV